MSIVFLRYIHEGILSLIDADNEQNNFAAKLKNLVKDKIIEREFFLINLGLLFSARGKVLNNSKSRLFPKKNLHRIPTCEPTPEVAIKPTTGLTKHKSKWLQQEFINEMKANEKDINDEIFWNYFKYQNPSF